MKGFFDNLGYSAEQLPIFKKYATNALLYFSVVYCVIYCARLNLGLSLTVMSEGTGWSLGKLGILSSIVFWTYGIGHLFNGRLGDIVGAKRMIVVGVACSMLTNVVLSLQTSFAAMCVLWGLNGYFQSMIWSPGLAYLASWWPGRSRGFANGVATGSAALSSVAAWLVLYITFLLFPESGWQIAFQFPMLVILVPFLLFVFFTKEGPDSIGLQEYKEPNEQLATQEKIMRDLANKRSKLYPYIFLLKQWRFLVWAAVIFSSSIARYGLLTWIPAYYVSVFNVNIKEGILGTLLLPLGMAFGAFIVPYLTDKFCPNNRSIAAMLCALLAGVTVLGFSMVDNPNLASALLFVAGFAIHSITSLVWAYATDIGGRVFSGTAVGILDFSAYMGAALQSIIFGSMVASSGSWHALFIQIGVLCFVIVSLTLVMSIKHGRK